MNTNVYSGMYTPSGGMYRDLSTHQQMTDIYNRLLAAIVVGAKAEAENIDFYERLVKKAPNKKHKDHIKHAIEDEKIHLRDFTALYVSLTGKQPQYQVEKISFSDYQDGLRKAYEVELEAYENYRDAYLLTPNMQVRDVFLRAYTDEIEHAVRFGFLLTSAYG